MQKETLMQVTANMLDWLNTWRQDDGAYNGYVVHRFDLKRVKNIHDTPWEQTPIIDGLFNIYKATNDLTYYNMAKQSVLLQISRLDTNTGMFDFAGFEDDRFSSLVHNSLADCALLTFAENARSEDYEIKEKALDTVKCNFDKYFFGQLYSEEAEAFKFSAIDYYWPQENRYVANMNSVAIEAMMRYSALSGEEYYRVMALKILKSVVDLVCIDEGKMENGGIGYANTHPKWYISIYTALALRGICEVYKYNHNDKLRGIMLSSANHLLRYTSEEGYFFHAIQNGIQMPYPYWVAGGGMILKAVDDVSKATGVEFNVEKMVNCIIDHQQNCGGVSSFLKYNTKDNHRKKNNPDAKVWEEIAPGPPWNAHLFEYFSRYVDDSFSEYIPQNTTSFVVNWRYIYFENKKIFFVCSLVPLYSCALILIQKKKNVSLIGFSLRNMYSNIRRKFTKR